MMARKGMEMKAPGLKRKFRKTLYVTGIYETLSGPGLSSTIIKGLIFWKRLWLILLVVRLFYCLLILHARWLIYFVRGWSDDYKRIYFNIHTKQLFIVKKEGSKNSQFERWYNPWIIDRKWPWRKRKVCLWHVPSSNLFCLLLVLSLISRMLIHTKWKRCTCADNAHYSNASIFIIIYHFYSILPSTFDIVSWPLFCFAVKFHLCSYSLFAYTIHLMVISFFRISHHFAHQNNVWVNSVFKKIIKL